MKSLAVAMMAIIAVVGWSSVSRADTAFIYSGTTVGGPVFVRPNTPATATSSGQIVHYQVQMFEVNLATTCTLNSIQNGVFDGFLYLYQATFNPLTPTIPPAIQSNDNSVDLGVGASLIIPAFAVLANTPYFVVTSGSTTTDGDFQNFVTCNSPSAVTPLIITHGSGANLGTTKALLAGNRFQVSATGTSPAGTPFTAQLTPFGSDDSVVFSFFTAGNLELLVKVINFCSIPAVNAWKVFAAGVTTAGVDVSIVDTLGAGGTFHIINPTNTPFTNIDKPMPNTCP